MVRAGDVIDVEANNVLLREDRIGYWFFAVLGGSVRLTRRRRTVATLAAGAHIGDVAILGFGPQPLTATTLETSRLFVMGRRELLNLAPVSVGLQKGLFPGDGDPYRERVRRLRSDGAAAWAALPRRRHPTSTDRGALPESFRWARPSRPARSFNFLSNIPNPLNGVRLAAPPVPRLGFRTRVMLATSALAALTAGGLLYKPPIVVVRPEPPIDAAADITVDGRATHPPTGHYVVTTVSLDRPNAFGLAFAMAAHQRTVHLESLPDGVDEDAARRRGLAEFADAQQTAVVVAAKRLDVDPAELQVHFRSRDIAGPSAALIYGLALTDLLDNTDLARGRTIAATGALEAEGKVEVVGFVDIKARVASRAHASVFLVPPGQVVQGRRTVAVATFADAIAALRAG